jgi:hypothetical protein
MKTKTIAAVAICALIALSAVVSGCICCGSGGPSPTPVITPSPTPGPGVSPYPVQSVQLSDWGADRDTYARGETATGWVYVTNTGNVPVDEIDFTLVIRKTIFFVPVEKTFSYNTTGLNIPPGQKRQVEFSQVIPSDYEGISTAGDYKLSVTAYLAGRAIGSYSRDIKVV